MNPVVRVKHFEKVKENPLFLGAIEPSNKSLPAEYTDLVSASNLEEGLWLPLHVLTYLLEFLNVYLVIKLVNQDSQVSTFLRLLVSLLLKGTVHIKEVVFSLFAQRQRVKDLLCHLNGL